jgi:hypothetical protein
MSKIFEHGNWSHGDQCPICGTVDDEKVVLVAVLGTQDGYNVETIQVHLDCLLDSLVWYPGGRIIVAMGKYSPRTIAVQETEPERDGE